MSRTLHEALRESYEAHRDAVWGACYRLTGTVQDADELTQETYLRLRERPPERLDESLRNWLLTVAANLCRDRLRRRKRTSYLGPWLPAPAAFDQASDWFVSEGRSLGQESPEQSFERLESASYAFLLALEELSPNQRSVLLLRDVYDFSVRETAQALGLSPSNVKTTHHRARKQLEKLDRRKPTEGLQAATRSVLEQLLQCIATDDFARLEELFRDDVRLLSDGGDGQYTAATRPVVGRAAVVAFLRGISKKSKLVSVASIVLNGLPALVAEFEPVMPRQAPRAALRVDLDEDDRIRHVHLILAAEKTQSLTDAVSATMKSNITKFFIDNSRALRGAATSGGASTV